MRFKVQNAAIVIVVVNILFFILQQVLGSRFTEAFILVSKDAFARPWILLTSMFLHANSTHLLFNMYALFVFGPLIEQRIGSKRFLFVYFLSGIVAALASIPFYPRALGASGAIMGILGVTIMLMPDLRVLLFFMIPMSLRTAGIIFALIDIFGIFVPNGVANIAHLAGLGCGLGFGYYLLRKKKDFTRKFVERPKKAKMYGNEVSIELSDEEIDDYIRYGRL
ncbi:rhomboid family intramembrane serine protease [Candidatus Woesearchaeota archaeon]|nr:MAG: rhomboid family intramembrane serine protease [Candidatus Woesearchaeota archaeon]